MNSPYSIAQETLVMSDRMRGIPGMTSPVRPGPNAYDQGGASKPSVNTQPYNNERLAQQFQQSNIETAGPQSAANAMGKVRSDIAASSDSESKAQLMLNERMSQALYANQSGSALMKMNSIMQSPEKAKSFRDGITIAQMTADINPDLLDAQGQANQYM